MRAHHRHRFAPRCCCCCCCRCDDAARAGSGQFNRALSTHARTLGLRFGWDGLRPILRARSKTTDDVLGECIAVHSEADVFARLGVHYYEPRERSFTTMRPLRLVGQQSPPSPRRTKRSSDAVAAASAPRDAKRARVAISDDDFAPPLSP